ncbi:MAG: hypothetical protein U9R66_05670 [Thermodesulfobacteriota bacterium]|nr:hypothetical protein [Thermodesulfobacteriota bacterium]
MNKISGHLKYKPGVTVRTHYFLAAMIWSLVGLGLLARGFLFLHQSGQYAVLLVALVLGTLKAVFVLQRSAGKNIERIGQFQGRICFGAVFSFKAWSLVLLMVLFGRWLRSSGCPPVYIGLLYAAVGWALLFSSRVIWLEWRRCHE